MGFYVCGGRGIREKDIKRVLVNNMCVCVCVCVCVNGQKKLYCVCRKSYPPTVMLFLLLLLLFVGLYANMPQKNP